MYKRFGCSEVNTELDVTGRKSGGSLNFEENEVKYKLFLEGEECVTISKEFSVVGIPKNMLPFFYCKISQYFECVILSFG
jgi:hypothetical protein